MARRRARASRQHAAQGKARLDGAAVAALQQISVDGCCQPLIGWHMIAAAQGLIPILSVLMIYQHQVPAADDDVFRECNVSLAG
jgi:hypothetical protein